MSANEPDIPANFQSEVSQEASPQSKTGRPVIYIGSDLYNVATQHAITVSYMTGTQVSPAKFTQYLIKEFGDQAVNSLSAFIKSPKDT